MIVVCSEETCPTPGQASLDLHEENNAATKRAIANIEKIFFTFIYVFNIVIVFLQRTIHHCSAK